MSNIVGIIAEYNPFHTGHKYQIDFLKQKGYEKIIVAQSGSCVQRGELALLSKFDRAKMAVQCGVSLVCEIPAPYSMLSAEGFAKAGISILKNLNVDAISFGSECCNVALLVEIAQYLLTDEYTAILKSFLAENLPFASARQKAILEKFDLNENLLCASNDILALEYIKACLLQDWHPDFIAVQRKGAAYNDIVPKDGFASASYLRNCVASFDFDSAMGFVPDDIKSLFQFQLDIANYCVSDTAFEKALLYSLRKKTAPDYIQLPDCNKELSFAFENAVSRSTSVEEIVNNLPTKQYTRARLRRIMLFALLEIRKDYPESVPFIRMLALDKNGQQIVKSSTTTSSLPISHSYRNLKSISAECARVVGYESLASDTRSTFCKLVQDMGTDYTTRLFSDK